MIIGIEACGYTNWFEELMEQLGHKLLGAMQRRLEGWPDDDRRTIGAMGGGLLTSLCLVHTLGDSSRFSSLRKVAAYDTTFTSCLNSSFAWPSYRRTIAEPGGIRCCLKHPEYFFFQQQLKR